MEPRLDGSFSEDTCSLAKAISSKYFSNAYKNTNPFFLQNATKHILADTERQLFDKLTGQAVDNVFKMYQIDESKGDRLLYIIS